MRTGRDLILATKPFAQEIRWKSWLHTISTLSILISLYIGIWFVPFLPAKIVLGFLAAFVQVRFFIIFHDFQHHAILSNSILAEIIFFVYGVFILNPPSIWKRSHDYHHNHNSKLFTANIGSYPIMTVEKFAKAGKGERFYYLFQRHPITIFFGYIFAFFWGMCCKSFISSPIKHWDSLIAIVSHIALNIFIWNIGGPVLWFCFMLIPFFVSSMMGAYLFYAQHNFPDAQFETKENWTYHDAALYSSSYMKLSPFWQWCTGNIGFHHVHHMNSRIPFYRLEEAMNAIPEFSVAGKTSLKPKDVAACFRIKLWDPKQRKMIPMPAHL